MNAKKFVYSVVIFIAIGLTAFCYSSYFLFRVPSGITQWINDAYVKKTQIAEKITGRKIVFAGGSGTHFGIRTADVEQALHIPAVNYGVHAGLPITYILKKTKGVLHRGDIVILPLEYFSFSYEGKITKDESYYIRTYDRDYFTALSFDDQFEMITQTGLGDMWTSLKIHLNLQKKNRSYNAATINDNGDETANTTCEKKVLEHFSPIIEKHKIVSDTTGLKAIIEFSQWCDQNGIMCYVSFANTIDYKIYHSKEYRHYFRSLEEYLIDHRIRLIGHPEDFFFPLDLFYDTAYHLNQKGSTIRTRQLIERLQMIPIREKE